MISPDREQRVHEGLEKGTKAYMTRRQRVGEFVLAALVIAVVAFAAVLWGVRETTNSNATALAYFCQLERDAATLPLSSTATPGSTGIAIIGDGRSAYIGSNCAARTNSTPLPAADPRVQQYIDSKPKR